MSTDNAPWATEITNLLAAGADNPTLRFTSLATVSPSGDPEVRTMVIREVRPEADQLVFHTDGRSQKIKTLEANPKVELCWYFIEPWLQFRLKGQVQLFGPNDAGEDVAAAWGTLSPQMKQSFFWGAPGSVLEGGVVMPDDISPVADNFRVAVITVHEAIRLNLQTQPHHRTRYTRVDGNWTAQRLW